MKKLCALFFLCSLSRAWAGDPGTTSANFLKLGIGPRAIAMGEAQVGLADDVYATYWNPAGLAQLQVPEAGFVHTKYFSEISSQYAAYAHPHRKLGTFAGSVTLLNVGDFDGYDAQGQPTGQVDASDLAIGFSYARPLYRDARLGSELSVGATAKFIRETLADVSAQAYALDTGLLFVPGRRWGEWGHGWRAGMALRNLGSGMKFDQESFTLPRSVSAGLSWTGVWLGETITLAVDGRQPNDGERSFGAGIELWTLRTLVLRGGYTSHGDLGNGLRAGAGLRFKTIQVDYAFAGAGDFGNAHRIGLTFRFSQPPANKLTVAEEWYRKGMKEFNKQRYPEALVHFNKALEIDPSHPQALDMMHQTYDKLKTTIPQ